MQTTFFFAKPYSACQRGTNDNTNSIVKYYLSKGTDFSIVTHKDIQVIEYKLNNKPIKIDPKQQVSGSVLATGFSYDKEKNKKNIQNFFNIESSCQGIRRFGSAAYDLCLVAAGNFGGYWEMELNHWDIAAGDLIVREAGGKVIIKKNNNNKYSILAGNDAIVEYLKNEINF